jgi:hypothetical protein
MYPRLCCHDKTIGYRLKTLELPEAKVRKLLKPRDLVEIITSCLGKILRISTQISALDHFGILLPITVLNNPSLLGLALAPAPPSTIPSALPTPGTSIGPLATVS